MTFYEQKVPFLLKHDSLLVSAVNNVKYIYDF